MFHLLSPSLSKYIERISIQKAKISAREEKAVKRFYNEIDKESFYKSINKIIEEGHPPEIREADRIKKQYEEEKLSFDDIKGFSELYKSNINMRK